MTIERVDFPIKHGGSFHSDVTNYQKGKRILWNINWKFKGPPIMGYKWDHLGYRWESNRNTNIFMAIDQYESSILIWQFVT